MSLPARKRDEGRPQLQVHQPDVLGPHSTLRAVWDEGLLPAMVRLRFAPATLGSYGASLNVWEAAGLGGVPIGQVGRAEFLQLYDHLDRRRPRPRRQTIANHAGRLLRLLEFCTAPVNGKGDLGRERLGILEGVPIVPAVAGGAADPVNTNRRVLADQDVRRLLDRGCRAMSWPTDGRGGTYACRSWRAVLLAGLVFGLDLRAAKGLEGSGYCWGDVGAGVLLDRNCPAPDAPQLRHRWGWLCARRSKTGVAVCVPLPELVHHVLAPFVKRRRGPVFRFGGSCKLWQKHLQDLRTASGVDGFKFKDTRTTCSQWWLGVHRDAPTFVLGHTAGSMALGHYTSGPHMLLDLLPQFEQHLRRVLRHVLNT